MHACALENEVVKIRRVVEAFPLKFWCGYGVSDERGWTRDCLRNSAFFPSFIGTAVLEISSRVRLFLAPPMVRLYWKNLSMVRLPPLTFQKIPLAPFTRILLSAAEIFLQTQIRLHLLPLPESCSLTPRMMRPSIFRMLRLLLLQDSMRSVSMHLPNRRVYLR